MTAKTAGISIRASHELREKLHDAAKANFRSLAQEVEMRLTDSFKGPAVHEMIRAIAREEIEADRKSWVEAWDGVIDEASQDLN